MGGDTEESDGGGEKHSASLCSGYCFFILWTAALVPAVSRDRRLVRAAEDAARLFTFSNCKCLAGGGERCIWWRRRLETTIVGEASHYVGTVGEECFQLQAPVRRITSLAGLLSDCGCCPGGRSKSGDIGNLRRGCMIG